MPQWPIGETIRFDGSTHPLVAALPFYGLVPKEPLAHYQFRVDIAERCLEDLDFRAGIWDACAKDFLFFVNVFCIAAGTPVVTQRGPVPIEDVTSDDKVWDGEEWVSQGGALCQGRKSTIFKYGIHLTPDHEVWTTNGWQVASAGYDRSPIRLPDGYSEEWNLSENEAGCVALPVRLRRRNDGGWQQSASRKHKDMRLFTGWRSDSWTGQHATLRRVAGNALSLLQSAKCRLLSLWRSWDSCLPALAQVREFCGGHGPETPRNDARTQRQRRGIFARELSLGILQGAGEQHATQHYYPNDPRANDRGRGGSHRRDYWVRNSVSNKGGVEYPRFVRPTEPPRSRQAAVYDLINCGPRRAFTVIDRNGHPLLVHNCWIIEPRDDTGDSLLPFNTWSNQDPVMAALAFYLGKRRDICGDKSRAQGASWIVVALYVWAMLFRKRKVLGAMSKDEITADDYKDPNSLGWKIDFIIKNLPVWMRPPGIEVGGPERNTSKHTFHNVLTDTTIKLFAANVTSGRGGRFTSFFFDEAGSFGGNRDKEALSNLQQTCHNRIVISTPNGTEIEFYRLVTTPSIWLKVVLDWEDNPSQNPGKYTSCEGVLEIIDADYQFPSDYQFLLDGIVRSPWFDNECDRANHDMVEINRELRRDHGGSKSRPFPEEILAVMRAGVRDPYHRGKLAYERSDPTDLDAIEFVAGNQFPLKLWVRLDAEGLPPVAAYVVNADIGAGTGGASSNSCIQVFNGLGEQCAEFACNRTSPPKLAKVAVAMCYWLGRGRPTPFLNWEKTGPLGTQFSREVERLLYPYVYYMRDPDTKGAKRSGKAGWHTSKTSATLEPLVNAITNELIVIRSVDLLRECGEYEFGTTDWEHPGAKNASDPSNQGFNHGDRAVAAGVAIISLRDRNLLPEIRKRKEKEPELWEAPAGSMAGRFYRKQQQQQEMALAGSCVW